MRQSKAQRRGSAKKQTIQPLYPIAMSVS